MDYLEKIVVDIELHSVSGIRECFENGLSPNAVFRGEPLLHELISEYTRSPRFKDCVKTFVDFGLKHDDLALLAVLYDDAQELRDLLRSRPGIIQNRYTFRCAYTPLHQATLMHLCAEFNHVACATVLVEFGAGIDSTAGTDEHGFGGQTPVFHTVNQNGDQSRDMLRFLVDKGADLRKTIPGLIWGKSYPWETFIPAVNPVSYCMMGLLPQMHRDEKTIHDTVSSLMKAGFDITYQPANLPNAYLKK
jgi:hypothetical protein